MTSSKLRRTMVALAFALTTGIATEAAADPPYFDQITPGELRGVAMTAGDPWVLGYWEYLPADYEMLGAGELLPLLVFLPGIGEYDDDSSCPGGTDVCAAGACGNDGLCHNLTWGPQQLMQLGTWDDTVRPFIMVSPQNDVPNFSTIEWDLDELDAFFDYIVANYPVDPRRLYLTGMSQGGRGVLQYVSAHPRRFAAAAPMPGGQVAIAAVGCTLQDTALWAFHGEDDNNANLGPGTFSPCTMVEVEYQYQNPDLYPGFQACVDRQAEPGHPPGRISMFYDVGHFAWQQAIDPVGLGFPASEWLSDQGCGFAADFREYAAALDSDGVYSWLLALDRPDVVAPDDYTVPGDDGATQIAATVTDDDVITWSWTQIAGPVATLDDVDQPTLQVSGLQELTQYQFDVLVVDADGQWDRDQITIDVLAATGGTAGASATSDGGSSGNGSSGSDGGGTTGLPGTTDGATTTDGGTTTGTETGTTTGTETGTTTGTDGGTTGTTGRETDGASSSEGSTLDTTASTSATTATTSAEATTTPETGADDSGSLGTTATTASGSASQTGTGSDATAGSLTGGDASGGSSDTTYDGPIGEDTPGGCGCTTETRGPLGDAPWMLLALVSITRRCRRADRRSV